MICIIVVSNVIHVFRIIVKILWNVVLVIIIYILRCGEQARCSYKTRPIYELSNC